MAGDSAADTARRGPRGQTTHEQGAMQRDAARSHGAARQKRLTSTASAGAADPSACSDAATRAGDRGRRSSRCCCCCCGSDGGGAPLTSSSDASSSSSSAIMRNSRGPGGEPRDEDIWLRGEPPARPCTSEPLASGRRSRELAPCGSTIIHAKREGVKERKRESDAACGNRNDLLKRGTPDVAVAKRPGAGRWCWCRRAGGRAGRGTE